MITHLSTMISISMAVAYGYNVAEEDDVVLSLAEDAMTLLNKYVFTESALVNSIPLLRYIPSWFPGANFKKDAERGAAALQRMQRLPIDIVKEEIVRFSMNQVCQLQADANFRLEAQKHLHWP